MRFLLTILIWIVLIGGLKLYTAEKEKPGNIAATQPEAAGRQIQPIRSYTLNITPTFTAEKDPFSLDMGQQEDSGMEIRVNGHLIQLESDLSVTRGRVIAIRNLQNIEIGLNELFIHVVPPLAETDMDHGIRLQIVDNHGPVIDQTMWSTSGAPVSGTLLFELSAGEEHNDH